MIRIAGRIAVCVLTLFPAPTGQAQEESALRPSQSGEALFAEANSVYAEADSLVSDDPAGARALYLQSAAMYGQIIDNLHVDNFMLHLNRANALLRAGDVGRAVAAYRRAERLQPGNERVRAGLAATRAQSATEIRPSAAQRAADALLWWRTVAPRELLLVAGAVAYLLAWTLALTRLAWSRRWLARAALASGAVAAVSLGSLALEDALVFGDRSAVVIASEVVGRNGPDAGAYEATFSAPLSAGVEGVILETRNGWAHVRLADGRTTWLPESAIEMV